MEGFKNGKVEEMDIRFLLSIPVFLFIIFFYCINSAYTQTESQNQESPLKLPTFSIINKREKIELDSRLNWYGHSNIRL